MTCPIVIHLRQQKILANVSNLCPGERTKKKTKKQEKEEKKKDKKEILSREPLQKRLYIYQSFTKEDLCVTHLETFAFVFIQDSVTEVTYHSRQTIPQRDLWFPVQKLLCFAYVWFPLVRIICCVRFELYGRARINHFLNHLHTHTQVPISYNRTECFMLTTILN